MYETGKIIEERLARLRRQYKLDTDSSTRNRIEELVLLRGKLQKAGLIPRPQPKYKKVCTLHGGGVPGLD